MELSLLTRARAVAREKGIYLLTSNNFAAAQKGAASLAAIERMQPPFAPQAHFF